MNLAKGVPVIFLACFYCDLLTAQIPQVYTVDPVRNSQSWTGSEDENLFNSENWSGLGQGSFVFNQLGEIVEEPYLDSSEPGGFVPGTIKYLTRDVVILPGAGGVEFKTLGFAEPTVTFNSLQLSTSSESSPSRTLTIATTPGRDRARLNVADVAPDRTGTLFNGGRINLQDATLQVEGSMTNLGRLFLMPDGEGDGYSSALIGGNLRNTGSISVADSNIWVGGNLSGNGSVDLENSILRMDYLVSSSVSSYIDYSTQFSGISTLTGTEIGSAVTRPRIIENRISGYGIVSGSDIIDFAGEIRANETNQELTFIAGDVENKGVLSAADGGILRIVAAGNREGNFLANPGLIRSDSNVSISGLVVDNSSGRIAGSGIVAIENSTIGGGNIGISASGGGRVDLESSYLVNTIIDPGTRVRIIEDAVFSGVENFGRIEGIGTLFVLPEVTDIYEYAFLGIPGGGLNELGTFVNSGTISPGQSPGSLDILGNLTLTDSSVLEIEMFGSSAGEFDSLNIAGELTLGGTLSVDFGDFVPDAESELVFLFSDNITGGFSNISIGSSGLSGDQRIEYDLLGGGQELRLGNFRVNSIPEPSSFFLLLSLLGIKCLVRQRVG